MPSLSGLLILDKPVGWTSHDAVSWVRRRLAIQHVGHAGTLDPGAEGVLVIAVGAATRLLHYVQDTAKQYVVHAVLGIQTTTDDVEGEITAVTAMEPPPREMIDSVLEQFRGEIVQIPPRFSAIKQEGTPLYRRARAGANVAPPPRTVTIHALHCLAYHYPDLFLVVECSKGTYIRALVRDIGAALGTGAYVHQLVRTRVGHFSLEQAWSIAELETVLSPSTWSLLAFPPEEAFVGHSPALFLGEQDERAWYHGALVRLSAPRASELLARVYTKAGQWAGIARPASPSSWRPIIVVK